MRSPSSPSRRAARRRGLAGSAAGGLALLITSLRQTATGVTLLALTAALAASPAREASAGRRVVLRDCNAYDPDPRPPMVKPRRIECGAVGAPDFRRLTWRGWGSGTARASGTVTYRDCPGPYPGCADPRNYHTVPVSLRVYRIRVCDGRRAYTRLRATLRKVDGEQSGYSLDLTVNWGHCRA